MQVAARLATREDLGELVRLYRALQEEMAALHPMWSLADGLAEPVELALSDALEDADSVVLVGLIDALAFGFLLARSERLVAGDERIGSIRAVFTEPAARGVGVGEAMRDSALAWLRERGHWRFDAHVLPGHRAAKNFFEAGGFSARSIVMHHRDDDE